MHDLCVRWVINGKIKSSLALRSVSQATAKYQITNSIGENKEGAQQCGVVDREKRELCRSASAS